MLRTGIITEYGYDNLDRLISVETRTLMSDIMASYAYTLNSKGQRTHVEERVGTQLVRTIDYTYDDADRLTEEKIDDIVTGLRTITYSYDPVGNRLTKDDNGVISTYDYDDNDRLLTEGGFSYDYDNNGNLLSKTGNGEQYDFTYNALNQLVHADINTGVSSSSVDYVYDHDGIRVGKTINGTDVTKYLVDKNRPYAQVLEEQWTNGALSATTGYVYGDALISRTTNGTPFFYHYDGMGSTRTLTDMSGAVTDTYSYDAYGNLLDKTGSTINPYRYRGEQYDEDLSSYYLRARYYQPGIGRFLTADPVEGFSTTPISLHRYVYGSCDPVNHIDPSGRMSITKQLVAGTILVNLGLMAASTYLEEYWGVYSYLGEKVLPDAYVIGINGFVTGKLVKKIMGWFDLYFPDVVGGLTTSTLYLNANAVFSLGLEALFNISSAQVAGFAVPTMALDVGIVSTKDYLKLDLGFSVYQGYVWNLWNADDYTGNFTAVGFGWDSSKRALGGAVFFDPTRALTGPWGIARYLYGFSVANWAFGDYKNSYTILGGWSYYYMIGRPGNYPAEWCVGAMAATYSLIGNYLGAVLNDSLLGLKVFGPADVTIWAQSTVAKYFWNKKSGYSVSKRQQEGRPKNFQSGPGFLFLGYFIGT